MAVNWSTTAPTVVSWSETQSTPEARYRTGSSGSYTAWWYVHIDYNIGRIPGTKNIAIKAVLYGRAEKGYANQHPNCSPRISLDGGSTWSSGTNMGGTPSSNGKDITLGTTQYATITGETSNLTIRAQTSQSSAASYTTLTYPLGSVFEITLNPNKGTVSPTVTYSKNGDPYGPLPTPTRTTSSGKEVTFLGWYTALKGGSKVLSSTVVTASAAHTLYAHWDNVAIMRIVRNGVVTESEGVFSVSGGVVSEASGIYIVENGVVKESV